MSAFTESGRSATENRDQELLRGQSEEQYSRLAAGASMRGATPRQAPIVRDRVVRSQLCNARVMNREKYREEIPATSDLLHQHDNWHCRFSRLRRARPG